MPQTNTVLGSRCKQCGTFRQTWVQEFFCSRRCSDAWAAARARTNRVSDSRPVPMGKIRSRTLQARLDAQILPGAASKKTELELHGMGGTPRKASRKHAAMVKGAYKNRPRLDYLPPETELTYEQEIERLANLSIIADVSRLRVGFAPAPTAEIERWEKEMDRR